ncbi:conserved hypothetical protein [Theileria orientalis strain Shintoku]|uniref:Uncharacterized protein n=1 Tax=Theileria orientalis strain Shintoku TaxID=869250 RepID=J4D5P0_THEOR|nr:conserved hypothetical protein [Theileria orientalis strain Shintoku]PVC53230.1 hypothetical protein MACL_00000196 [Theileria orientalis]BAM39090.1 conserved hypothetical protein [Theileria orientalis strain Shintoku]|eukprot:XP_009689391.1 conserved hypothetical protein [Theileria orientalis strain Shintoku]
MAFFRDVHHLRQVCKNLTNNFTDKRLQDFFFHRSYRLWFNDPTQYVYYFLGYCTIGVTLVMSFHHLMGNPDVTGRTRHLRNQVPDRHMLHAHSIPFFNHALRNYSQRFTASLVDNEHDYAKDMPYAFRQTREKHYGRFPFIYSAPRYFVDTPEYENTLHDNVEKRYRDMGYYNF